MYEVNIFILIFTDSSNSGFFFSHVESLWVQEPLFIPIVTRFKFRTLF